MKQLTGMLIMAAMQAFASIYSPLRGLLQNASPFDYPIAAMTGVFAVVFVVSGIRADRRARAAGLPSPTIERGW